MKTLYQCEICKELYSTSKKALDCEKQKFEPTVKVGDIVLGGSGFGWFDGDKRWISNFETLGMFVGSAGGMPGRDLTHDKSNCFSPCCTYRFYYVVTAIDRNSLNPHEVRYHLATKAMTGKGGYSGGYTSDHGHIRPMPVKDPPKFIVEDSKSLIGVTYSWLL